MESTQFPEYEEHSIEQGEEKLPLNEVTNEEEIGQLPQEVPPAEGTPIPTEAQLPPEAQGEANGGPLGCCLGVMVGLTLSVTVGVLGRIYADNLTSLFHDTLGLTLEIVMCASAIVGAILFGYLGWKTGKRFYKEYDPPVITNRRRIRTQTRPRTLKTKPKEM